MALGECSPGRQPERIPQSAGRRQSLPRRCRRRYGRENEAVLILVLFLLLIVVLFYFS